MKTLISNARRTVSITDAHVMASADAAQQAALDPLELLILAEDKAAQEDNVTLEGEKYDKRNRNSR